MVRMAVELVSSIMNIEAKLFLYVENYYIFLVSKHLIFKEKFGVEVNVFNRKHPVTIIINLTKTMK